MVPPILVLIHKRAVKTQKAPSTQGDRKGRLFLFLMLSGSIIMFVATFYLLIRIRHG